MFAFDIHRLLVQIRLPRKLCFEDRLKVKDSASFDVNPKQVVFEFHQVEPPQRG